jgi:hypothetical protein
MASPTPDVLRHNQQESFLLPDPTIKILSSNPIRDVKNLLEGEETAFHTSTNLFLQQQVANAFVRRTPEDFALLISLGLMPALQAEGEFTAAITHGLFNGWLEANRNKKSDDFINPARRGSTIGAVALFSKSGDPLSFAFDPHIIEDDDSNITSVSWRGTKNLNLKTAQMTLPFPLNDDNGPVYWYKLKELGKPTQQEQREMHHIGNLDHLIATALYPTLVGFYFHEQSVGN